jgi:hypothetical protein
MKNRHGIENRSNTESLFEEEQYVKRSVIVAKRQEYTGTYDKPTTNDTNVDLFLVVMMNVTIIYVHPQKKKSDMINLWYGCDTMFLPLLPFAFKGSRLLLSLNVF